LRFRHFFRDWKDDIILCHVGQRDLVFLDIEYFGCWNSLADLRVSEKCDAYLHVLLLLNTSFLKDNNSSLFLKIRTA
jgi:hypothetical protein